jgi:1-acyl-sn-glycerol-3-phosphate acyltransferase
MTAIIINIIITSAAAAAAAAAAIVLMTLTRFWGGGGGGGAHVQYLFSDRFRMRYVVKKSLLWDAGLDVMGSRTPNLFLEREAGAGMADELKALTSLLDDAHPEQSEDGTTVRPNIMTCIWPEGTRFSKSKREHILHKLRVHPPDTRHPICPARLSSCSPPTTTTNQPTNQPTNQQRRPGQRGKVGETAEASRRR